MVFLAGLCQRKVTMYLFLSNALFICQEYGLEAKRSVFSTIAFVAVGLITAHVIFALYGLLSVACC